MKYTIGTFKKLNEQKKIDGEKMQKQLDELNKKLNRWEERFINEKITKEMCLKYSEKTKEEKKESEKEVAKSKNGCSNPENIIDGAIEFAINFKPMGHGWSLGEIKISVYVLFWWDLLW